ncbi:hypothetical protein F4805DRAFT_449167 [Annulohypoxylon moriforme]|nr:hypothetical protein F4805DRAFT_449167 [Annulohypoxylon moriforme]
MDNLSDLLEEQISRRNPDFVAFGIGTACFSCRTIRDVTQDWTVVSIYINGSIDRNRAIYLLRQLESGIDRRLSIDQKPERLSFYLEDNSNRAYSAKSYRIQGRLSPRDLSRMGVVLIEEDGDKTRPATPRSDIEDTTRKDVEEIGL